MRLNAVSSSLSSARRKTSIVGAGPPSASRPARRSSASSTRCAASSSSSGQRTRRRSSPRYEPIRPFAQSTNSVHDRASAPAARFWPKRFTKPARDSARSASRRRYWARRSSPSSASISARRRKSVARTASRADQSSPLTTPASRDSRSHVRLGMCSSRSSSGAFVSTPSTSGRRKLRSDSANSDRRVRPSSMSPSARTGLPFSGMPAAVSCSCTSRAYWSALPYTTAIRPRRTPSCVHCTTNRTAARTSSSGSLALRILAAQGDSTGAGIGYGDARSCIGRQHRPVRIRIARHSDVHQEPAFRRECTQELGFARGEFRQQVDDHRPNVRAGAGTQCACRGGEQIFLVMPCVGEPIPDGAVDAHDIVCVG